MWRAAGDDRYYFVRVNTARMPAIRFYYDYFYSEYNFITTICVVSVSIKTHRDDKSTFFADPPRPDIVRTAEIANPIKKLSVLYRHTRSLRFFFFFFLLLNLPTVVVSLAIFDLTLVFTTRDI